MKDIDAGRQSATSGKDIGEPVRSGEETFPRAPAVQGPNKASPSKARSSPRYAHTASKLLRPAGWVATIVIGSLLAPAITKQWSDRPRELEIKTSMVRDISELSTDSIRYGIAVLSNATVKTRLLQEAEADFQKAKGPEKREAQRKRDAAFKATVEEAQDLYTQKLSVWQNKGAVIKAQLQAYFPGTRLSSDWSSYNTAVINYMDLNTISCGPARSSSIAGLRGYLGADESLRSINWESLGGSPYPSSCEVDRNAFITAYYALGDVLLRKQDYFLESIMKADMAEFSSGWRDFLGDII